VCFGSIVTLSLHHLLAPAPKFVIACRLGCQSSFLPIVCGRPQASAEGRGSSSLGGQEYDQPAGSTPHAASNEKPDPAWDVPIELGVVVHACESHVLGRLRSGGSWFEVNLGKS
jgi:hypothetical protein